MCVCVEGGGGGREGAEPLKGPRGVVGGRRQKRTCQQGSDTRLPLPMERAGKSQPIGGRGVSDRTEVRALLVSGLGYGKADV